MKTSAVMTGMVAGPATKQADGRQCAASGDGGEQVPGLAVERGVDDRGPGKLPRLRDQADRDQRRDGADADAGLVQQIAQGDDQIAVGGAERRAEQQEDDGVGDARLLLCSRLVLGQCDNRP